VDVGVSVGRGVASTGADVADGGMGVSVEEVAWGVGEDQERRRKMKKVNSKMRVAACLCMDGF
jgi:hypothetical protein